MVLFARMYKRMEGYILLQVLSCEFIEIFQMSYFTEHLKTEAVAQRCSVKKMFLEISQNSQENTCARVSFLIKLQS